MKTHAEIILNPIFHEKFSVKWENAFSKGGILCSGRNWDS
ncbi:hypothetical protein HMPREF9081_0196 [Centipeda periodontii DSM 2778]|uniref:Uncharacterized protein n=1 Tax=Centipeda periodontii DSM 2778 TaxID=888060 RepID=F5RJ11_9FIRM|nr:hypothetical protein HMPREF9081_0196 [Centipeda periodontii DSM 2778]